jgi:uncharacterized protein
MKNRKVPMRSCVVSHEKLPKSELIRVVNSTDKGVIVDLSGHINGRGAYIKRDINVLEQAIKSKVLEKHLDSKIDDSVYEELRVIINSK